MYVLHRYLKNNAEKKPRNRIMLSIDSDEQKRGMLNTESPVNSGRGMEDYNTVYSTYKADVLPSIYHGRYRPSTSSEEFDEPKLIDTADREQGH